MNAPADRRVTLAYRILHIDNVELLARRQGLHAPAHAPDDGLVYRAIHDQAIQAKRGSGAVPCGPGGQISDYVSFYLGPRSPMLYRIWKGQVTGFEEGQRPVIYAVTAVEKLQELGLQFVFTDGHSIAAMTEWFDDPVRLPDLPWDDINADFWFDTPDDPDRGRRKQAELLVHELVPWESHRGACSDRQRDGGRGLETAEETRPRADLFEGDAPLVLSNRRHKDSSKPMITLTRGNLLEADTEALVNTVNTVGVMGKGIALQFKRAFPENYEAYRRACDQQQVRLGEMFVFETGRLAPPKYIVNFPTKGHWRSGSKLEDIESGLQSLATVIRSRGIRSIAIPPLGCGHGGLDWDEVRPRIERALADLEEVDVRLYEPAGAPEPRAMPERRKRPKVTPPRAVLIELMNRYGELGYGRTLLEVQKLAYFLQLAGEPLKLRYVRAQYGPFAHNLNKALQQLEGHFIVGLGDDEKPTAQLDLLPGAVEEARKVLSAQPEAQERFERVARLIEGFETPYGLELLASIHWLVEEEQAATTPREAATALRAWTPRKAHLFREAHVQKAWDRLHHEPWLSAA